jgi:hypothetical protein
MARPSEGYQYLIQSLTQGGGITKSYGTSLNRYNYCVTTALFTGQDTTFVVPAAGTRTAPTGTDEANVNIVKFPNSFYCGYDLEKSAGILFQGVNTRASPPFLNLFVSNSSASVVLNTTVNVNAWGMSDVILQVDTIAKQVTAFI